MVGILSREDVATTVELSAAFAGKTIRILVENQGRINFNVMNDFKGLGDVKLDGKALENWNTTGFPLDDANQLEKSIRESSDSDINDQRTVESDNLKHGPVIYHATFNIARDEIHDTYVNTSGWGKVNRWKSEKIVRH